MNIACTSLDSVDEYAVDEFDDRCLHILDYLGVVSFFNSLYAVQSCTNDFVEFIDVNGRSIVHGTHSIHRRFFIDKSVILSLKCRGWS